MIGQSCPSTRSALSLSVANFHASQLDGSNSTLGTPLSTWMGTAAENDRWALAALPSSILTMFLPLGAVQSSSRLGNSRLLRATGACVTGSMGLTSYQP